MRAPIIVAILSGFIGSPVLADPTVEELSQRIDKLEETVGTLVKGLAFLGDKSELKVAVPAAPDGAVPAEEEVIVNISADGSVHLAGKKLTLEELKTELTKLAEQNKDQPVRIRGDAALEYTRVIEVIDACQKAGLWELSFATQRVAQGAGKEECEDKLVAIAEVVPDLDSKFFGTMETARQPWIVEDTTDGSLADPMDGTLDPDDLLLIEKTANCISTHQGEHAMEFCDAVKMGDGVELEVSGGFPAYMSSLTVEIDAKRQFVCQFKAVYPSPDSLVRWEVTKKSLKLKTAPGEPGTRLRGWISVDFNEIDATGAAKSYKIEGYFKPVIQSAPNAIEEDK
ncbi:biopolymer transporter ExbD [Luteolibacter arcticus]|uniref:Biopolymer transporter ExbD n=1 Tax=Luteolibacter arcticus TaxID=1581411 RepID=A0ABT3GMY6_9BACT|nr:biopolymer transporter ExbD [Luteolibacter arcticus]MCW1924836.1 biopolymer transporter ExbD [Luteolibacter arcticus]